MNNIRSITNNSISLLVECAQICQMSSGMMAMDGQFSKQHFQVCATVCDKCAQECDMFKDSHCKQYADKL